MIIYGGNEKEQNPKRAINLLQIITKSNYTKNTPLVTH